MAIIRSSDLDFDAIKENLKTFLQQQDEFSDYDFEASGLSNILDVLAYNTHLNGLIANIGVNEAFLASAQLRSSVVSHAETLGYYARSKTGASTSVALTINTNVTDVTSITIPRYTEFVCSIDDVSYTFQTLETYVATNDGTGLFTVRTNEGSPAIPLYEGTRRTKTFFVGDTADNQFYVIPDENMDTSTISVNVFDTATSSTFTPYLDINRVSRINSDSTIYIIRETPNGYYELTFSDGVILGQRPVPGNKIVVTYLQTNGEAGNNGKVFTAVNPISINEVNYTLNTTLISRSAGGAPKEDIQSIKLNAPITFAAQQRLVTAEDYKALILANYSSFIEDVAAWGGQDNIPAVYGKVFVSLQFKEGLSEAVQGTVKNSIITNLTNNLSVMSIDTEFTDPQVTYLQVETLFNFNPDLSGNSLQTVENELQGIVNQYFEDNLNRFGSIFRRSNMLSLVDDFSPAVLDSRANIKLQQRFVPTLTINSDYTLDFPATLANPDDVNTIVTSTKFTFNNQTCFIQNQLNSTKLQIVSTGGNVVQDNVGSYNPSQATVNIRGLEVSAFQGEAIKISVVPANQATVKPLRNYILNIDQSLSFTQGTIDFETINTVLN